MESLPHSFRTKELRLLFGISRQGVHDRAKREHWRFQQPGPPRGGGGGHKWLVASMPVKTRKAIVAKLAAQGGE